MRVIFADTLYWIAILNPRDTYHTSAVRLDDQLKRAKLVTSELVIVELLTYFSGYGEPFRIKAAEFANELLRIPNVEVVRFTRDYLVKSIEMYHSRGDKEYSLTDCNSMLIMKEKGINEALTYDHHFAQEKYVVLLSKD